MHSDVKARVGFIGIGLMGTPMVRRLLDHGFVVTVWNRTRSKTDAVRACGASVAATPAALAECVDVICLCVADTGAVDAVVFGEQGIAAGARAGTVLLDFSSIAPGATRAMARRLRDLADTAWIDAPVSGGVRGATDGSLIVMCGGDPQVIESMQPVFAAIAASVTRMGGTGAGQATKLCNQVIVGTNLVAIAEAMALARAEEVDIRQLPAALAGGWADSAPLQIIGPHMAAGGDGVGIGALSTMLKDIETAVANAAEAHVAVPLASQVAGIYRDACSRCSPTGDLSTLARLYKLDDA